MKYAKIDIESGAYRTVLVLRDAFFSVNYHTNPPHQNLSTM